MGVSCWTSAAARSRVSATARSLLKSYRRRVAVSRCWPTSSKRSFTTSWWFSARRVPAASLSQNLLLWGSAVE